MKHQPPGLFAHTEEQPPHKRPEDASARPQPASGKETARSSQAVDNSADHATTNALILHEVAQITAQSFPSAQEAMRVSLEVLGHFLESQSLFVARVGQHEPTEADANGDEHATLYTLKIIAARNTGEPSPMTGAEGALNRTYCATIWHTQQPLIVEDVNQHPFYQQLPTTEAYHIGSYIGVPLIYSDGRVYGTLCSQDPRPRPLASQPEKLELMQIIARFLISYIEREELTAHLREAQEAQAALARQEQVARSEANRRVHELEAVFNAVGDGLLVSDRAGRIQMNTAGRHLLPGLITQNDFLHIPTQQNEQNALVRDEDGHMLALDQWPISRVLRGEHLVGTQMASIQRVNERGEWRYLGVTGMPIYDHQKQINGAVLVFRDVTERYLLQRRTKETLNALLTLAESLAWLPANAPAFFSAVPAVATSSLLPAWKRLKALIAAITQCQDAEIIVPDPETAQWHLLADGDTAHAFTSDWWHEALHSFAAVQESDTGHLSQDEVVTHTLPVQDKAQHPLLVEAPMFLGNRLLGVLALIYQQHAPALTPDEDALVKAVAKLTGLVHERERLLQTQAETRAQTLALQEINSRFNEFLSIASHELKGPLTALKGNVQLAKRSLRSMLTRRAQEQEILANALEKIQRYLERAERQVSIQDRLVSDLLDVARIRVGKLELHLQTCDIRQVVSEIVENQRQVAPERVITLEMPTVNPLLWSDPDRIGQVVQNYLTNALKYSAPDQPVEITVTSDAAQVRVTVSDHGSGLSEEEQKHVWERFYRARDVRVLSGSGIGLGLGLHICKTIIEQHGGHVGLSSAPGEGSHFWFTLPLKLDKQAGRDSRPA